VLERILSAKARLNLSNVFVGGGGVRGCGEKEGVAILLLFTVKKVGYTVQKIK
jgi:hypothetical protein